MGDPGIASKNNYTTRNTESEPALLASASTHESESDFPGITRHTRVRKIAHLGPWENEPISG